MGNGSTGSPPSATDLKKKYSRLLFGALSGNLEGPVPSSARRIRCVIVSSWLSHQWSKPSSSCVPKHLAFHMSSQHFAFSGLWAYTPPFASRRGVRSSSAWSRRRTSVALLIKEEAGRASHQGERQSHFSVCVRVKSELKCS
jgi:hypothetical protein